MSDGKHAVRFRDCQKRSGSIFSGLRKTSLSRRICVALVTVQTSLAQNYPHVRIATDSKVPFGLRVARLSISPSALVRCMIACRVTCTVLPDRSFTAGEISSAVSSSIAVGSIIFENFMCEGLKNPFKVSSGTAFLRLID